MEYEKSKNMLHSAFAMNNIGESCKLFGTYRNNENITQQTETKRNETI